MFPQNSFKYKIENLSSVDLAKALHFNGFANCESFIIKQNIDGQKFLTLGGIEIVQYTNYMTITELRRLHTFIEKVKQDQNQFKFVSNITTNNNSIIKNALKVPPKQKISRKPSLDYQRSIYANEESSQNDFSARSSQNYETEHNKNSFTSHDSNKSRSISTIQNNKNGDKLPPLPISPKPRTIYNFHNNSLIKMPKDVERQQSVILPEREEHIQRISSDQEHLESFQKELASKLKNRRTSTMNNNFQNEAPENQNSEEVSQVETKTSTTLRIRENLNTPVGFEELKGKFLTEVETRESCINNEEKINKIKKRPLPPLPDEAQEKNFDNHVENNILNDCIYHNLLPPEAGPKQKNISSFQSISQNIKRENNFSNQKNISRKILEAPELPSGNKKASNSESLIISYEVLYDEIDSSTPPLPQKKYKVNTPIYEIIQKNGPHTLNNASHIYKPEAKIKQMPSSLENPKLTDALYESPPEVRNVPPHLSHLYQRDSLPIPEKQANRSRNISSSSDDNMALKPGDNLTAILYGINDLRLEQKPIPTYNDDQVLLRMEVVGICGSDIHYLTNGRIGDFIVEKPMVMGHESSGTVLEVGKNVKHLKPGDRVAIEPGVCCRRCSFCKTGRYNLCKKMEFCATPPVDGNLARYFVHSADFCYKLHDHVSLEEGALLEPLSVGVHACKRGNVSVNSHVLVLGAGPIGLVSLLSSKAFGASKVIITDVVEHRLKLAKYLGADATVLVSPKDTEEILVKRIIDALGCEPTITMDCSGAELSVRTAIRATRSGGSVVLVGMGKPEMNLPLATGIIKEIDIRGVFRYANDYQTALELVATGKVDLKPLITHNFSIEETKKAFDTAMNPDTKSIKVIIYANPKISKQ